MNVGNVVNLIVQFFKFVFQNWDEISNHCVRYFAYFTWYHIVSVFLFFALNKSVQPKLLYLITCLLNLQLASCVFWELAGCKISAFEFSDLHICCDCLKAVSIFSPSEMLGTCGWFYTPLFTIYWNKRFRYTRCTDPVILLTLCSGNINHGRSNKYIPASWKSTMHWSL